MHNRIYVLFDLVIGFVNNKHTASNSASVYAAAITSRRRAIDPKGQSTLTISEKNRIHTAVSNSRTVISIFCNGYRIGVDRDSDSADNSRKRINPFIGDLSGTIMGRPSLKN